MPAKFRLVTEHLYWWPVEIKMPSATRSGAWDTHSFEAQFAAVPASEARKIAGEIAALASAEERAEREHAVLIGAVRDWRNVVDDDDQPVPFSEDALRQAMELGWFRNGLYRAYFRSLVHDDARLGN